MMDECEAHASVTDTARVAAQKHVHNTTTTTILGVPEMCCPTEFKMVEKELRRVGGVVDVTPDFMRKTVRIEHGLVAETELLAAAKRSGLEVHEEKASHIDASGSERSTVIIEKMDCPAEETLIRNRLESESWVTDLSFNLVLRKLIVNHTSGRLSDVLSALQELGMAGRVETPAPLAQAPTATSTTKIEYWKLAASIVFATAAEATALAYGDTSWAAAALAVAAIALSGLSTYRKGLIALRQRNLNINALMSVAVTGAAILGQWPEAAMVMILFAIAEMIEARSLDRARRAVEGLMALAPDTATVQTAKGWEEVAVTSVAVGAIVRVRPGERIALDCTVTSGTSAVDQSPITGESVPIDKTTGDPVFAGTVNQNGELECQVTALSSGSTLARITRAVQEAQGTRAPTQRFVDSFARYYTPAVFAMAVAVAIVPPLLGGAAWFSWVYRALVLLVIACPCALVISTPVAVVSGLTAAARRGILIKGGLYLEQGYRLKVLALDKTGTLTRGRPTLTDIYALQGTETDVLRLAAALSARSDHPVSKAISARATSAAELLEVLAFKAHGGRGIEGVIDGVRYRLGNHRLVEESDMCSPELEARLDALEQQGKTAVVLAGSKTVLGILAIADEVRAESAEAIAQLKRLGVRPVMLTGDNRHTADAIARQVGITDVRSELLPEEKLKAVEEFLKAGTIVGMVGDGINDAPALAKADIGFAMGAAGTDTAIETADVALMDDDPRKLAEFIRLSRATKNVLWQNITLALGIKAVFLTLALAGQATLWMAVFADMGASLLVVANGLRLLRRAE